MTRATEITEARATLARLEAEERAERAAEKGRPVVVCTKHRGVFFGYTHDSDDETIRLREARMCVYWSQDVRGVVNLSAAGPTASCKITAATPEIEVRDVTYVAECSDDAAAAWERGLWSA